MRGKNKSFLEDTIILFVIGIIIYAIYTFFFASNDEIEVQNNINTIEKTIEDSVPADIEPINNEKEIVSEKIDENIVQTQKEEIETIQIEKPLSSTNETLIDEKVEPKKTEVLTNQVASISQVTDVELFYKNIEEKIYANIEKNIDTTSLKNKDFVNIRVTILKDGRYEQLTFMDGNKDNFELFRSSITQAFPFKMNDTLKENFPRYFRMKIEVK